MLADPMAPATTSAFEHQGHRLVYSEYGSGPPPPILRPGLLLFRQMYAPPAAALGGRPARPGRPRGRGARVGHPRPGAVARRPPGALLRANRPAARRAGSDGDEGARPRPPPRPDSSLLGRGHAPARAATCDAGR